MNLDRTGFNTPIVGTVSYAINTGADGNIAYGDTVDAGYKRFSLNNIKADATKTIVEDIFGIFFNYLLGKNSVNEVHHDDELTTFTVKWESE